MPNNSTHPHLVYQFFFLLCPTNDRLKDVVVPNDLLWIDSFARQLAPYCSDFDPKRKLMEHIGPSSSFSARYELSRMLYLISQWQDDPEKKSFWDVSAPKVAEGMANCSLGLHERCTTLINACYKPKNLQQLLAKQRLGLLEAYLQLNAKLLADTHDADLVQLAAHEEGYGIEAASTTKVLGSQASLYTRIKSGVIKIFNECYQLPCIVDDLIAQIKLEMSTEEKYTGLLSMESNGYPIGFNKALEKLLSAMFTLAQAAAVPESEDSSDKWLNCYEYADHENDDWRVLDIDWLTIHLRFWEFLFENELINQMTHEEREAFLDGVCKEPDVCAQQKFIDCVQVRPFAHDWVLYAFQTLPWFPNAYAASRKTGQMNTGHLMSTCLRRQPSQFHAVMTAQGISNEQISASFQSCMESCVTEKNVEGFNTLLGWAFGQGVAINVLDHAKLIITDGVCCMLEQLYQLYPELDAHNETLLLAAINHRAMPMVKFLFETKKTAQDGVLNLPQGPNSLLEHIFSNPAPDENMAEYLISKGVLPANGLRMSLANNYVSSSMVRKLLAYIPKLSVLIYSLRDYIGKIEGGYFPYNPDKLTALKDCLFLLCMVYAPYEADVVHYSNLTIERLVDLVLPLDEAGILSTFYNSVYCALNNNQFQLVFTQGRADRLPWVYAMPKLLPILQNQATMCFELILDNHGEFFFTNQTIYEQILKPLRQLPVATQQFWMNYLSTLLLAKRDGIQKIHMACYLGLFSCVRQILSESPQLIKRLTKNKLSPLHLAIQSRCVELVDYLIEKGANPQIKQGKRSTLFFVDPEDKRIMARLVSKLNIATEIIDVLSYSAETQSKRKDVILSIILALNSLTINELPIVPLILSHFQTNERTQTGSTFLASIIDGINKLVLVNQSLHHELVTMLLTPDDKGKFVLQDLLESMRRCDIHLLMHSLLHFPLQREHYCVLLRTQAALPSKALCITVCQMLLKSLIISELATSSPQAKRQKISGTFFKPAANNYRPVTDLANKMISRLNSLKNADFTDEERQTIAAHEQLLLAYNRLCAAIPGFGVHPLALISSSSSAAMI